MKRSQPGLTRWPIAAVAASSFVMMLAGLAPGFAQQVGGKAVEIMRQSMTARGQVDYSAVAAIVRYREGERHDARQMVLRQQGDRECIKVLDGDGKLKFKRVSDGRTRWEHSVRHGRVMKMPLPPRAETLRKDLTNLEILADNFELTLEGPGTVAGRVVHRITITHPGPPRVLLRRLWIDEQNYLELKS
ncbi:MAG TPA: hypothetical protein QGH10_14770, partial [Armatimonadota bacterium]|nr:hypothetical protein [Armatimonadota bacterium]